MPEKRERHPANIKKELAKIIKMLASKENRNFTQQVHALLEEAIARRKEPLSIEQIKGKLHAFSVLELAEIAEAVSQTQQQKIKGASETIPKTPENPLAQRVLKNRELCWQIFQELPNGSAVLQRIIDGEKPPNEALPPLAMCLSLDADELENLLEQSFENGTTNNHHHS